MTDGDETPFDSTVFEGGVYGGGGPSRECSSDSEMALRMVRVQPKRDPNDIRETYGLPRLEPDELEKWLEGGESGSA